VYVPAGVILIVNTDCVFEQVKVSSVALITAVGTPVSTVTLVVAVAEQPLVEVTV